MKHLVRVITALVVVALLIPAGTVAAQEDQPPGPPLSLNADYPGVVVGAGETVTIDVNLRSTLAQQVHLGVEAAPEGWTVDYRGSGQTVTAAYLDADQVRALDIRIQIPDETAPGTYEVEGVARGDRQGTARLTLTLTVQEESPQSVSLEASRTSVSGSPNATFRYDLTLENQSEADLSVELGTDVPAGFTTRFTVGGGEVTSVALGPNEARNVVLIVDPANDVEAGKYPILVRAAGPTINDTLELTAEVTGDVNLSLTTPDGRLSAEATVGQETPLKLLISNDGSAPAEEVKLSSSEPSGWEVTFEPAEIPLLSAGETQEVTMKLQPAEKAIAGDYEVSVTVRGEDAESVSKDFRITVVTSTLWGVVGIGLIAVAVVVVGLAVARFGRR
ncbi:MAG: NEW3 domain-containing protein [Anaerolineae bacterium]